MQVWPVLIVWDTTLPSEYREMFQQWWSDTSQLLTDRYGVRTAVKVIQLFPGGSVRSLEPTHGSNDLHLYSESAPASTVRVSSAEFESFVDAVRRQQSWLRAGPVVAPTFLRISHRPIDRGRYYGELVRDLANYVQDLMVFEYQVNSDPRQDNQWLTEKMVKALRLKQTVRHNFSPKGNHLLTFFAYTLANVDTALRNQGPGGGNGLNVRPKGPDVSTGQATAASTAQPAPVQQNPAVRGASKPWSPNVPRQDIRIPEERPTREFRPLGSTLGGAMGPPRTESRIVEPATVQKPTEAESVAFPSVVPDIWTSEFESRVTAEPVPTSHDPGQPDDQTRSDEKESDMKTNRFKWFRGKRDGASSDSVPDKSPENSPGDDDSKTGNNVVIVSELEALDEAQRTENGQLIVDTPSTINSKPWYAPKWFKVPVVGPSRDVELEYGGVNALRLMAASVRGTRHQFYGEPNEDAFAIGKNDKFIVVAVCDGVGTAEHSAYGSKFISFSVARSLAKSLESVDTKDLARIRDCITLAVQGASDGVQSWSDGALFAPDVPAGEVDRHDLSATLVVGVVEIEASSPEGRTVVIANVGDSPCYTFADGEWRLRTNATKDGEVLEHATTALPTEVGSPVVLEWHDFILNPREQLLLMTDGIGTSLASGRTPLGKWLGEQLASPMLAQRFLKTVDAITFDRQGEDDDRTLVVLYDLDHAFSEPAPLVQDESSVDEATAQDVAAETTTGSSDAEVREPADSVADVPLANDGE
jgi:serine/threonine protein phosphatase PrpC